MIHLVCFISVFGVAGSVGWSQENQIVNGEFDDGLNSWGLYGSAGFTVEVVQNAGLSGANAVLIDVTDASATSSIGISQSGLLIEPGVTYPIGFTARAEQDREMVLLLQADISGTSWPTYLTQTVQLTTSAQDFVFEYTHSGDTIGDDPGETLFLYLMLKGLWWSIEGDDLNTKVWFDRVYFGAEPPPQRRDLAENPDPVDGATDVPRDVVLSWKPGIYADKHDVYFGNTFDEVNDASTTVDPNSVYKGRHDPNSYPIPKTLDFGETYYWRIDEVNAPPDDTIYRGNVWQFTVEPFAYPIDGDKITAMASSVHQADRAAENTINGSGLDADELLHSTQEAAMWLSAVSGPQPTWIRYEFDKAYKLREMWVWNFNGPWEPVLGFGFKDATVEYSTNGTDWTTLSGVPEFAPAPGEDGYAHNTTVDFGGAVAKVVKITAHSNWKGYSQYGLSEARFLYIPGWAREPNPDYGAAGVGPDVVLRWRAGREAATHDVYFGTDEQAVIDGTAPVTTVSEASYDAGTLDLGRTYYWRVDEVNQVETPTTWAGDVWNFTTPDYLIVDSFEQYDDFCDRIFYTWTDGWGHSGNPDCGIASSAGNDSGSTVGHITAPFAEQTIVHEGGQSMPFGYDNTESPYYSETERSFDPVQDWTRAGVKALVLYFYGDPSNAAGAAERLYVAVEDNLGRAASVAYDGAPSDMRQASWHEWNINLKKFSEADVSLTGIKKIYLGVGNRLNPQLGNTGNLYFDDIRLYPSRCVSDVLKPAADLNDDCVVDSADVQILTNNWLISTYEVVPAAPGTTGLAGHWTFDNAANLGADSVGNNNGTVDGDASQSANAQVGSGSLALDGDGDFLNVRGGTFFSALDDDGDGFTVAAWVQFASRGQYAVMRVFSTNMSAGGSGGWGFGIIQPPARVRFTTYGIRDYDTGDLSGYLPSGQWLHVAAVYKSDGDVDFYIDGSWAETLAGDFSMNDGEGFLIGGLAAPTATEWFEGLIDDLHIYDRELSQSEVGWLAGKTTPYNQDLSLLLTPKNPAINGHDDNAIDLKDYAVLANQWLDEQLWP
jgi:hypothetical protein